MLLKEIKALKLTEYDLIEISLFENSKYLGFCKLKKYLSKDTELFLFHGYNRPDNALSQGAPGLHP